MALDVEITRTELPGSLPNLELNAGDFKWSSTDSDGGGVVWDRERAGSKYVDGETLVNRKKALVLQPARVIVTGANNTDLRTNLDDLIDAFSQFSFQITIDPDNADAGVTSWTWQCECADYSTGLLRLERNRLITDVTLSIPRMPDPVSGFLI